MRIFVIIGTRPEAIKMLPLVRELRKHSQFETKICFSHQHEKMAQDVFSDFEIYPDFTFDGMKRGMNLSEITVAYLKYFDMIFKMEKPDLVLSHGDTTTAFCASLSAFYLGIPVGHIEAGLRTFDNLSPFPEEFNRVGIDEISKLCFAPTDTAAENLRKEGRKSVFTVGNTVIDALKYSLSGKVDLPFSDELKDKKLLLVTTHRRENIGTKMRSALLGIRDILEEYDDTFAILPAHPNPMVAETVNDVFQNIKNIKICAPMPMRDFHTLLCRAFAVFTDSGGIQEEAAYLGIPLFLIRDNTERPECVLSQNVRVVGTDRDMVKNAFELFLNDASLREKMRTPSSVFGDGCASEKITDILLQFYHKS